MKNISKIRFIIQLLFTLLTIVGFFINSTFAVVAIMALTLLAGAFYCGWICPFGTLQDFMSQLGRFLKIKKKKMPLSIQKYMKYSRYLLLGLVSFTGLDILFVIMSYDARSNFNSILIGNITSISTILVLVSFALISLFFERPFCNYFCIEGAKNGLLSTFRVLTVKRDTSKCVNCKKCDRACPMNIEVSKHSDLRSLNCINCFNCVSQCPVENTLKYGKVNLQGKQKKYYIQALLLVVFLILIGIVYSIASGNNPLGTTENISFSNSSSSQIDEVSETLMDSISYEDGIYTGIGQGFKGDVEVQVTVNNGSIANVEVLSNRDDRRWFNRANSVIPQAIIQAQSTDVDTVTGATFSSLGIIQGAENALANVKILSTTLNNTSTQMTEPVTENFTSTIVNEPTSEDNSTAIVTAPTSEETSTTIVAAPTSEETSTTIVNTPTSEDVQPVSQSLYTDGTYIGTGQGFKGTMEVSVTIENDKITDVTVLSNRDDRKWFNRANNAIPMAIINAQSPDVDTITGATFSSRGIIEGARNAINSAK